MRKIAAHSLQHWGQPQRDSYISELFGAFGRLAASPQIATGIDSIRERYRQFPQGSHVVFFRESASQGIEIIRVLHKRMDAGTHLNST
jgi:toxin ParE1/3/4